VDRFFLNYRTIPSARSVETIAKNSPNETDTTRQPRFIGTAGLPLNRIGKERCSDDPLNPRTAKASPRTAKPV
jgi:hypothetical protein